MTIESLSDPTDIQIHSSRAYRSNFLMPKSSYFNVNITINHWQLKDLVCRSSSSNSIYFPSGTKVSRLDFDPQSPVSLSKKQDHLKHARLTAKQSEAISNPSSNVFIDASSHVDPLVANFESSPRCLKEAGGVVVVGGVVNTSRTPVHSSGGAGNATSNNTTYRAPGKWKGLFGIHVNETGYSENGHIGTLINNSVTINKISNTCYRSLVCNNDQNLYIVDVLNRGDGLAPEFSVNMGVALNHASLSPDLKTIVTLGDSSRIFVLHPEENLRDITNREVISTQSDCGFSTSWNDSGYQFSACFQEGVNFIYDIRHMARPMHEIYSTRRQSQNGAFRVCKYSSGTDDLLFISEHQGRVHVVDTRDFMTHQVVLLPKMLYDYEEGYYNQPIVKDYQDVCDIQNELGYLSSSRRFIADVDVDRLHNSKFFKYTSDSCPKRYPATSSAAAAAAAAAAKNDLKQSTYDPLMHSTYLRGTGTGTLATTVSRNSRGGSSESSDKLKSPLTDPFYYLDSELEICGLEVLGNSQYGDGRRSLVIGTEDGLVHWNIDSWKRRCFPSYELA
ncbi:hypothetical protein FOA43_002673 [Brettanomyces nanus]|uniref:DUF2415 domain-containing protein n=1 Tax=Eeniella nana TaxID=13502 RepID=A0A875S0M9_EENNA|nr:uncharacterized protein FOA43_002673 [Brettanomyces nanus]QPG75321.1 hypothetical protein FOA43_002673 [Brettanomyces nanus]